MQTRDQEYALKIFQQVGEVSKSLDINPNKYGSMAHRLPILIRTAGLAQAVGFVESRGDDSQKLLLQHVSRVVSVDNLGEASRKANLQEYMRLTRDVMAALVWYKRFAESVLGVDQSLDGDEGAGE
jgi:CRISPR-associated protein Cmr5